MKNKKTKIAIISVVALLLVLIGVTYAYWLVTKTQTNSNIISSACLDITLDNETNDINLSSQYPLSKEDGMALTPYTFKVTNNCNTSIDYQVALESIGSKEGAIKASALQVALDTNADLLSNRAPIAATVSGAYAAHRLGYGTLSATGNEGSSVSHSLRIWIDENAPISEANKTFQSKISVTVGQGVNNPIKEGTIAYDILSNNDEPTTLSAAWVSKEPAAETYSAVIKTANNWYGTDYTLDEETGNYQLSGTLVQATLTECRNETKACGEYTLKNATQDYSSTTLYKITSFTSDEKADSGNYLYMTTQSITATNEFSEPTQNEEGGLYKTLDDLGESYYFRGDVTNNYVQFGAYAAGTNFGKKTIDTYSFQWCSDIDDGDGGTYIECLDYMDSVAVEEYLTLEMCESVAKAYVYNDEIPSCYKYGTAEIDDIRDEPTPMYWRIIRINGDGTIRLVYDGVDKVKNGIPHKTIINDLDSYNVQDYRQSETKEGAENWYNTNLTNYGGYIADGIFCNDKVVTYTDKYDEFLDYDENGDEIYQTFITDYFAPYTRLDKQKKPSLTCTRKEDRYTTNTTLGNGLLEYSVGVLTADEVVFAGGAAGIDNNSYYLYTGEWFTTMSQYYSDDYSADPNAHYVVTNTGKLTYDWFTGYVRPVINLRADVEFTGNGSFETPYIIKTK